MNISSNISSINTHQRFLDNSARNISVVNKEESIKSVISEGVENTPKIYDSYEQRSTDLAQEMTNQSIIDRVTQANGVTIKTQDAMLGTILDIKT